MHKHQIELFMDNRRYTIIEKEASRSEHWVHTEPAISKSTLLPRVLVAKNSDDSLSMVRALLQIKDLLENNIYDPTTNEEDETTFMDKVNASLDAVGTMLAAIK